MKQGNQQAKPISNLQSLRLGTHDYGIKLEDFDIAQSHLRRHLQLRDLSTIQEKMKKTDAVHALITSNNHEINNALMTAAGMISRGF